MNSLYRDSEVHIDISKNSEDLFEDSLPSAHDNGKSPDRVISTLEISSDTSEELNFLRRRKPKRGLDFSNDSSDCSSKKSSDGLINRLNISSDKFFCPIPTDLNVSNEVDLSKSPDSFKCDNLSKNNVEIKSFVSESDISDSSSILNDSQDFGNDSPISKKSFRTPLFSSVKKRTIRHWLNNVSNCSLNVEEKGSGLNFVEEPVSDVKLLPTVITREGDNFKETEKLNSPFFDSFDNSKTKNHTIALNSCPSLFEDGCDVIISSNKQDGFKNINNAHYSCNDSSGDSDLINSKNSLRNCREEPLLTSINPTRVKRSSSFKFDQIIETKKDESHSATFVINHINSFHQEDSGEESFNSIIKFSRKKQNHLNTSSDDSEAKDTANDSESNHNIDTYTPRKRLYFRNPLNNSLDDDAEPLNLEIKVDKEIPDVGCSKFSRSNGIINRICAEVENIRMSDISTSSVKNHDFSSDKNNIDNESLSFVEKKNESLFSNSNCSIKFDKPNGSYNKKNLLTSISKPKSSDTCISGIHKGSEEMDNEVHEIEEIPESSSKVCNESFFSTNLNANLNESLDSVIHIKRKSKRNVLNYSTDESFDIKKSNSVKEFNLDTSPVKIDNDPPFSVISSPTKAILIDSDHEYDKFIYRVRSDTSSDSEDDIVRHKDCSEEVITICTTTSEDIEDEDEGNAPWMDLEAYLKKNVPASAKSIESPSFRNMEKRKARLKNIQVPNHSKCPEHTSFILSLTPDVPEEMCHPEAVKYRGESFQKHKNELVDILFKLFNREFFDDKLPPLEIKWSGHLTTTSGITKSSSKITKTGKIRSSSIKLSKTVVDDASKLRDVLLHELCHAANWLIDEQSGGHGPLFKKWANKIWMKFPEIPKVKTTHHYELKWKYLYKCTYCGYELGKMKLSLNETSCRLCGGLVTVNT